MVVEGERGRDAATGKIIPERIRSGVSATLGQSAIDVQWLEEPCQDRECWLRAADDRGLKHLLLSTFERREPDTHVAIDLVEVEGAQVIARVSRTCELCGAEEIIRTATELALSLAPKVEYVEGNVAILAVRGTPVGATIAIDGEVVGTVPWEGEVDAGEHQVRLNSDGHFDTERVISLSNGVHEFLDVKLQPRPEERRRRPLLGFGAGSVGLGVALIGGGSALIGIDERNYERRCTPDSRGECPYRYDTLAGGISMVVTGALALGTGIALLIVDRRSRRGRERNARIRRSTRGLALAF